MSHWSVEMAGVEPRVAALEPGIRPRTAYRAVAWAVRNPDAPIEDSEAASFIAEALDRIESAVRSGATVAAGADEMSERYWSWFDEAWEPGVAQLCSAALLCFAARLELSAATVMEALLDCYEGVLLRATDEPITPEVERSTPQAVEALGYQRELIELASAGRGF
ncbi:hypothetical protein [Phytomonospora endophytica]|uniref:Uncharacterized protein n=1 Tax=Phytomonospora endophytica TaxID=714109 RepID=A0A841G2B7_9ACTN|nr:hypothetical protein [Phytomonospora endophytica]MBB6039912.1 hypothetical protein [Phytomonospora endophytica]GIG71018.1 hypothetical protein Pen01_73130 [Phytomonospora endophytica]